MKSPMERSWIYDMEYPIDKVYTPFGQVTVSDINTPDSYLKTINTLADMQRSVQYRGYINELQKMPLTSIYFSPYNMKITPIGANATADQKNEYNSQIRRLRTQSERVIDDLASGFTHGSYYEVNVQNRNREIKYHTNLKSDKAKAQPGEVQSMILRGYSDYEIVKEFQKRDIHLKVEPKYGNLYCDTSGISNYDSWMNGRNFRNTYTPGKSTNGGLDEDIMIMMNDGIEFFQDPWQNFDRLYSIYLNNDEVETRQYVFFVRPELYLVDDAGTNANGQDMVLSKESRTFYDPFMQYMKANHEVILRSLTAEFGRVNLGVEAVARSGIGQAGYGGNVTDDNGVPLTNHCFIPYLVGRTESLQIPDYQIKTFNLVQPYTKYALPYSTSTMESQSGGTFDVTFREDAQMRIHKLFFTWIYYMDGVMRNRFKPKDKYIMYNAIDYATSVYHIVCDVTGQNIIWWSKYTGVIPTSVPNSDLSFNRGGKTENTVTIPFSYFYHEALNPHILSDFNYNSLGYNYMRQVAEGKGIALSRKEAPLYDTTWHQMGTNLVGRPYITTKSSGGLSPKLHWMVATDESALIH